jgi:hypothetical protein
VDREQFWHLYVNANSLAELAIVELGRELDAAGSGRPPARSLSDAEMAARLAEQSKTLDLSALDGLDWDPLGTMANCLSRPVHVAPEPIPETPASFERDEPADFDAYLNRAYDQEENLRLRVDAAFARIDLRDSQSQLTSLPTELAPLTTRLTGEQLAGWLVAYRAGDPGLGLLVTTLCAAAAEAATSGS